MVRGQGALRPQRIHVLRDSKRRSQALHLEIPTSCAVLQVLCAWVEKRDFASRRLFDHGADAPLQASKAAKTVPLTISDGQSLQLEDAE